jgi:hypothetical protein
MYVQTEIEAGKGCRQQRENFVMPKRTNDFQQLIFVIEREQYAYRNVLVAEGNTEGDSSDRIRLFQTPNDEGEYLAHGILELILKNFADTPGLPLDIDFVKLLEEYTVQASVGE